MRLRVSREGVDRSVGALAAIAVVAGVAAGGAAKEGVAVAGLGLLLAGPASRNDLLGHVGWIGVGAAVLGAVGWVAGTVVDGLLTPILAAGMGIAVGGGLGAVVRLLAVGEPEPTTPETVTVDRTDAGEASRPEPRPADLFEQAPDPILYYGDAGDGPVVRAVNPAFESTFGVSAGAVTDAALGDALMVAERADDLDEAARKGGGFDAVVDCETPDGTRPMRVRVAADTSGEATDGYVLYTPTE